jgi:hypothetical protein
MGDFEGVGRVYRTELNPTPERHPQLEKTDRDRRGKGEHPGKDDEPHDRVELHEEDLGQAPVDPGKKRRPTDRHLDISA